MNILCGVNFISYFCDALNTERYNFAIMILSLSIIVVIILPVLVVKP